MSAEDGLDIRELLRLGRIGLEQGYWQQADAYFCRALELAPGHPGALLGRARAVREPREALACARAALEGRPGSREAQLLCSDLEQRIAADDAAAQREASQPRKSRRAWRPDRVVLSLRARFSDRSALRKVASGLVVAVLLGLTSGGAYWALRGRTDTGIVIGDPQQNLQPLAADVAVEPVQSDLVEVTQAESALPQAERAIALVLALDLESGQVSRGSGSVIGSDGLIVTNHHVIEFASGDPLAFVGLTKDVRQAPAEWYIAAVVATDAGRDLAVLRIRWDVNGQPVSPRDLDTVVFGDADALSLGQELIGLGYPALGGDTLTLTRGSMAGFVRDERGVELGKTDSELLPGSSGGAVLDARGRLVGVITAAQADYRTQGRLGYFVLLSADDVLLQRASSATIPNIDVSDAVSAFRAEM